MKRKSIWVGAVMVLMVVMASMILLADFGRVGAAQDLEQRPPQPQPCNCPANYEPVACRVSDGTLSGGSTLVVFSNACQAGCAGYTRCEPYPHH